MNGELLRVGDDKPHSTTGARGRGRKETKTDNEVDEKYENSDEAEVKEYDRRGEESEKRC